MFVDYGLEIKADPFSIESVIAWTEKQPTNGAYNYVDGGNCFLCQYFRACGIPVTRLALNYYQIEGSEDLTRFPAVLKDIAQGDGRAWTFGAALRRARKALAAR